MANVEIFGDPKSFAIRHERYSRTETQRGYSYVHCHLILGDCLIGSKANFDYISTWTVQFLDFIERVKRLEKLEDEPYFNGLSDCDVWEFIRNCYSVVMGEEVRAEYHHLVMDHPEDFWGIHFFDLGQTTDEVSLRMIKTGGALKILFEGWRWPWPAEDLGLIHSSLISFDDFYRTARECLIFLKSQYTEVQSLLNDI